MTDITSTTEAPSRPHRVSDFVASRVAGLQKGYLANRPAEVSQLARLRRAAGQPLGSDLALLAFTTGGFYRTDARLPETPTDREQAIHTAITLYAVHQQSKRTTPMHQQGIGIGRASSRLAHRDNDRNFDAVRRHFERLGAARSWDSVQTYARALIQQLRANDIPLDYGRFADDLVAFRDPRYANDVRNRWGRDFYRVDSTPDTASDAEPETDTEA